MIGSVHSYSPPCSVFGQSLALLSELTHAPPRYPSHQVRGEPSPSCISALCCTVQPHTHSSALYLSDGVFFYGKLRIILARGWSDSAVSKALAL